MSGAEIAAEVDAALLEVAQETGGGEILARFERRGILDETVYPPTLGATTDFSARIMQVMIRDADKDGENILDGDVMLMVSAAGADAPQIGDRAFFWERSYSVVSVDLVAPGGVPLYYKVQARGSNT